ncbi:MAG: toll/interleukin-1 receptor domain-containing protein [Sphingobacteriaceae bacterium]
MPTLLEYFNNDFKDLSLDSDLTMTIQKLNEAREIISAETVIIKRRVKQDHNSSCRLFTFYIPERVDTLSLMGSILDKLDDHKKEAEGVESIGSYQNDVHAGTHKSVFSNRLYFYIETPLTPEEIVRLDACCKEKNMYLNVRSSEYINTRMKNEKPLAFISHDSRNKELIAKPLANGLSSRLCSVWYDEYSLKVGQSLRESIEDGIKNAKKCILILTKEFLTNPGWTKKEFNSIFTREMIFNERIVIPIWYDIKKEEVYDYSPSLADTVALIWPEPTKMSEDEYKKEVEKLISKIHTAVTE